MTTLRAVTTTSSGNLARPLLRPRSEGFNLLGDYRRIYLNRYIRIVRPVADDEAVEIEAAVAGAVSPLRSDLGREVPLLWERSPRPGHWTGGEGVAREILAYRGGIWFGLQASPSPAADLDVRAFQWWMVQPTTQIDVREFSVEWSSGDDGWAESWG
jgi:hypothetical protein